MAISIIAVLASLLLPTIQTARSTAQRLACMSRLRQIGIALNTYASDNRETFPPIIGHAHVYKMAMYNGEANGLGFLTPDYIDVAAVESNNFSRFLTCPGFQKLATDSVSYMYHGNPRQDGSVWGRPCVSGIRNGNAIGPARFTEPGHGASSVVLLHEAIEERPVDNGLILMHPHPRDNFLRTAGPIPLVNGGNTLFVDGHAQWIPAMNWRIWFDSGGGDMWYKPDVGF